LQRCADDCVVPGRPGDLLLGLEGAQVGPGCNVRCDCGHGSSVIKVVVGSGRAVFDTHVPRIRCAHVRPARIPAIERYCALWVGHCPRRCRGHSDSGLQPSGLARTCRYRYMKVRLAFLLPLLAVPAAGCDQMLFLGARQDMPVLVDVALASGADIDARDKLAFTPLHAAVQAGHTGIALQLLDSGADPNAASRTGSTPLQLAASAGNLDLVVALLAKGADLERRNLDGWRPLHFAVAKDRCATAEFLLSRGAAVNAQDVKLATPLHLRSEA